jgi:hypothetical protein
VRLTQEQVAVIKAQVEAQFGPDAGVYLFGSRANDSVRGGDIDLYIELTKPCEDIMMRSLRLNGGLQQAFGAQCIDILIRAPGQPMQAVHRAAKQTGIRL